MPTPHFETVPIEQLPPPKTKPITQAWRHLGLPCPYTVIPLEDLSKGARIGISKLYLSSKEE